MLQPTHAIVQSAHGVVYPMGTGLRSLVGFQGTWMALTREQLAGVGNAIARILNCPFKNRHLEEGILLRTKDGNHRMPLSESSAREFHGLVNDALLFLEAQMAAAGAFGTSGRPIARN